MNKYRHIFFDLDHTLWDFDRNAEETLYELYDIYRLESEKIWLSYLQVPVNFMYKAQARGGSVFFGGGPYIGFGLSGSYSYTEYFVHPTFHGKEGLVFGDQYYPLHNPDIGVNALMGYRANSGLTISVGYGYGLTDVYNYGSNNKNEVLNFSVGYFFTGKQLTSFVNGH